MLTYFLLFFFFYFALCFADDAAFNVAYFSVVIPTL